MTDPTRRPILLDYYEIMIFRLCELKKVTFTWILHAWCITYVFTVELCMEPYGALILNTFHGLFNCRAFLGVTDVFLYRG